MGKAIYLTNQGIEDLKREFDELQTKLIPEIADKINRAKENGDLSENFEYHEAKERMAFAQGRLREIDFMLHNAEVYSSNGSSESVQLGSRITVLKDQTTKEFSIVGAQEANPLEGKISNESPLGASFLGKCVGDIVSVTTPKGDVKYTIKKIE